MRLINYLAFASLLLPPFPLAAEKKAPIVLERVGKWRLNYGQDSCQLSSTFGSGANEITLAMTRYAPGDLIDIDLYGGLVEAISGRTDVEIGVVPGMPPFKHAALLGTVGESTQWAYLGAIRLDGKARDSRISRPKVTPAQEDAVTAIDLRLSGREFRIATGPLGKPMQGMRTCIDDLLKSWSYDPLVMASLQAGPDSLNSSSQWLKSSDYPWKSVESRISGVISYRLDIDENGAITGCHLLRRTNPDNFGALTCRLIEKRARFRPALDATGKPVRAPYFGQVNWLAL